MFWQRHTYTGDFKAFTNKLANKALVLQTVILSAWFLLPEGHREEITPTEVAVLTANMKTDQHRTLRW